MTDKQKEKKRADNKVSNARYRWDNYKPPRPSKNERDPFWKEKSMTKKLDYKIELEAGRIEPRPEYIEDTWMARDYQPCGVDMVPRLKNGRAKSSQRISDVEDGLRYLDTYGTIRVSPGHKNN